MRWIRSTRWVTACGGEWLGVLAALALALAAPRIADGALVVVFDGSKFRRVDEERLASMRIIEWRIDGYSSAERRAAGRASAAHNAATAEQCTRYVREARAEFAKVNRFAGLDPNQGYFEWRFASAPYAVVDRKAFEVEEDAAKAARELEEKRKRDQAAMQAEAEQIRAKALAQQQEAQRQLEKATLERQRRENEAHIKEQARIQAEREQKIISSTVAKLESLRAQEEAITGAFRQIAELIQAKMEQDEREAEAREAREEARLARREAERLAEREQQLQEKLEQARQAAEDRIGFDSGPTEHGATGAGDTSAPLAAPDPEEAGGLSPSPSAAAPASPPRPSFAALLQSAGDEGDEPASGGASGVLGWFGGLFSGSSSTGSVPNAPGGASAMQALFGGGGAKADERPSAFRSLFSKDPEVAEEAKDSLKEQALWWLVENRYYEEHDTRIVGADAASKMDKMRLAESGADYLQNEVLDQSIPESVRIQGDAWRLLFLRGASGDMMGHATGHVDFMERWVLDRIETEARDPLPPPQSGPSSTGSTTSGPSSAGVGSASAPNPTPSAPMSASDRALVSVIDQRTRQANTAADAQARVVQLRLLLQESTTLPSHPEARRGVLYLRAAAALDLQDRDACMSARRALAAERADQAMSERERRLIEDLDKLSKE